MTPCSQTLVLITGVRVCKIFYKAFSRILLYDFEMVYFSECSDIQHCLHVVDFDRLLSSKELFDCTKLINFKVNLAQRSNLAQFWLSFLQVIEILGNLIYVILSGNWQWYVDSVTSIHFPSFLHVTEITIAYITQHTNLLTLGNRHPDVYNNFQKGNFSVQISEKNMFAHVETDKVINYKQRH